jgi:hypothetical protein
LWEKGIFNIFIFAKKFQNHDMHVIIDEDTYDLMIIIEEMDNIDEELN